jgi:hypothetical protein
MTSDTSPSSTSDFATGVGIQPPELSKKGKVTRSAIKDSGQAWQIYSGLENDKRPRTSINSEIVARHTGVGQIPGSALNLGNWGGGTTPNPSGSFDSVEAGVDARESLPIIYDGGVGGEWVTSRRGVWHQLPTHSGASKLPVSGR